MRPEILTESFFQDYGIDDIPRFLERMDTLHQMLVKVNEHINLTRITSDEGFWLKHVLDSLMIYRAHPELLTPGKLWVDLGCGAGFPSLVLASAFPKIHVTAIDSIAKKTFFVQSAGEVLELPNLKVITGRGRELCCQKMYVGKYDVLTARAVAEPSRIVLEGAKMLKPKGVVVLYQTPEQVATETHGENPCFRDGMKWTFSDVFHLPMETGSRQFLMSPRP